VALPLVLMVTGWSAADQSGTGWIGPFTLEELVNVESNSIVVGDWAFFPAYRYHQVVEGQRRDLKLVFDLDHIEMSRVESEVERGGRCTCASAAWASDGRGNCHLSRSGDCGGCCRPRRNSESHST
jgi:hypothetical protein